MTRSPIASRGYHVEVKSMHDMRTAYRAECTTCGRGGVWLTDRSVVVRNAEAHQNSEHVSQEAKRAS